MALGERVLVAVTEALEVEAALVVELPLAVAAALALLVPVLLALRLPPPAPAPAPAPVVPEMLGVPEWLALGLPETEPPPPEERLAAAEPESVRVGTLLREGLSVRLELRLTVPRGEMEGEREALGLGLVEVLGCRVG